MTVRTKWHRVLELLDAGEVYTFAPDTGKAIHHEDAGLDLTKLRELFTQTDEAPKFVVDQRLGSIAIEADFPNLMLEMKNANVLRLPYPYLWVEGMASNGTPVFSFLEDGARYKDLPSDQQPPPGVDIGGMSMAINRDDSGEYLCVSPSWVWTVLGSDPKDGEASLKFIAQQADWYTGAGDVVEHTYMKSAKNAGWAWFTIMMLTGTKGVVQDLVSVPKLNKQRTKSGKHPIPDHIFVRIGHVYQRDGSTKVYDERKSPVPHWRRGHTRRVRVGPGRSETRVVYIAPMIVAWHPGDGPQPKVREYVVTK